MNASEDTIIHGLGYLTPGQWDDFIRQRGTEAIALAKAVKNTYGLSDEDVGLPKPPIYRRVYCDFILKGRDEEHIQQQLSDDMVEGDFLERHIIIENIDPVPDDEVFDNFYGKEE